MSHAVPPVGVAKSITSTFRLRNRVRFRPVSVDASGEGARALLRVLGQKLALSGHRGVPALNLLSEAKWTWRIYEYTPEFKHIMSREYLNVGPTVGRTQLRS